MDACGTCNGDNTTCRFVNGTFRDDVFDSGMLGFMLLSSVMQICTVNLYHYTNAKFVSRSRILPIAVVL